MEKGLPVAGYVSQSKENIEIVNHNKEIEEQLLQLLDALGESTLTDKRWLAIGRSHIEQGFMAINRSIFKPERVKV